MSTVLLQIRPPLRREDLPGLFSRTCTMLQEHQPERILCDVTGVDADAVSMDALARLQLAARRNGCRVEFTGASPRLRALIGFSGLAEVL
jgi:ABC-type transporter Mla MlaB component